MIRPALFASLTGFHLAVMQFDYFFLLLINVTSTYVTYMTIVIAWMIGTLIGLLWRRLHAGAALLIGVPSYYAVYALVIRAPLAGSTLPIAALGIAITGLWAGRFFVVTVPLFTHADRLFLHENNGFLLGIIGTFVGFTMLGRVFLQWAPLLSGTILCIFMNRLGARHRQSQLMLRSR